MTNMKLLVVFGLLAVSHARPQNGYNYHQAGQHLSSSSGPAPQLLSISQNQQSPLQLSTSYGAPSLPAPSISQSPASQIRTLYSAPLQPQTGISQIQPSISYQPTPQQLTVIQPQATYGQPQSAPALPQPQSTYGLPQVSVPLAQPQSTYGSPEPAPQPQPSPAPQPLPNIDVRSSFSAEPQSQLLIPSLPIIQTSSLQQPLNLPNLNQPSASLPLNLPAPVPIITKYIYVHVAPEEPRQPPQALPPPPPPKTNYKIIFIKAPSQAPSQRQLVQLPAAQHATEEKTLVYVLVDKPQPPQIVLPTPAPIQPSKPEVYFIKYKSKVSVSGTDSPAGPTGPSLQDLGGSGGGSAAPVVEDLKRGGGEPINSGESTSSLFSGGLPGAQYGPPGYQKRSL